MNKNDALLEILRLKDGLRFTFLDRTRPSLSFEQTLDVPELIFEKVSLAHENILRSASKNLIKRTIDTNQEIRPTNSERNVKDQIHLLSEQIRHSLFPNELLSHIKDFSPSSLLIRTDEPLIPWELSKINGDILGVKIPIGRGLLTQRPLKRLKPRSKTRIIKILIISNPTNDLPGADAEADVLVNFFNKSPYFKFTILRRQEATVESLRSTLLKYDFDIIHYAGHSDYKKSTTKKGVIALNNTTITTGYLSKLFEKSPPSLVFFNSCNSAVVESTKMFFDDLNGVAPNLLRAMYQS